MFVDDAADLEGVDVGRLRWTMTKKARAERLAQVRDLAVQDALAKARGYTMSLGCTTIHVVALEPERHVIRADVEARFEAS